MSPTPPTLTHALPAPLSEDHLADVFAARWAGKLAYVHAWRRWYTWDGTAWREDATTLHCRLAVELTRQALYWPEAAMLTPSDRRKLNSQKSAWALLWLARNDRRIAARAEDVGVLPPVRWRRKHAQNTKRAGARENGPRIKPESSREI